MSGSDVVPIASSSNGRLSGKPWKAQKTATVCVVSGLSINVVFILLRRSHLPEGVKTKNWEDRMQKTQKALAIKKLQNELKDEKQAEFQRRREITMERKKAAEEKRRLEEAKAQMGARKAARLRRRAGRTKKINH
ncbi:hypothetical protein GALMADRAFT_54227 [Galerina marginata CBS 339.88]|uniref:rRNA-processing protein n=1 Tax=Galerina marginata (strain CBS 339.88) TaxID=685588 RepID=A0A067TQ43_GALM3|nr:hypothetical protein GALMADRAFT_54227 [Galerina marginata CBS 339.88]